MQSAAEIQPNWWWLIHEWDIEHELETNRQICCTVDRFWANPRLMACESFSCNNGDEIHKSENTSSSSECNVNSLVFLTETFTERTGNQVGVFLLILKESETETCWLFVVLESESDKILWLSIESRSINLLIIKQSTVKSKVCLWFHRVADCVVSTDTLKSVLTAPLHSEVLAKHTFIRIETLESFFYTISV